MTWLEIIKRALELFRALLEKLRPKPDPLSLEETRRRIAENEAKIRHHKELYRKNHPRR